MPAPIPNEIALKALQMASLAMMDVEILDDVVHQPDMTIEQIRNQVRYTWEKLKTAWENDEVRNSRYGSTQFIRAAVTSGGVRSETIPS